MQAQAGSHSDDPLLIKRDSTAPWWRGRAALIALAVLMILGVVANTVDLKAVGPSTRAEEAQDRGMVAERVMEQHRQEHTILSEVYTVDRKYKSMMGPYSSVPIRLVDDEQLVWITGYRAVMVGADGETSMDQEFMCHSNLDLDVASHREALKAHPTFSPRLFTLSQGQFDVRFPAGYGIPIRGEESLDLTTQVLNLNEEGKTFEVRHKVTIEFVTEADARAAGLEMRALQPIAAYGLALMEGDEGYFGETKPEEEHHGPGCLVGETASDHAYEDGLGRTFTGHWQVPPGRQENHTLVTHLMQVPYETRVHYIAVHLHPFAESLELRDLTAGTTVFRSEAENFTERIGLARVEHFESQEGIPLYPDHDYELVSVYDNTSGETQDSMAVMYMYLRDLEVEKHLARAEDAG